MTDPGAAPSAIPVSIAVVGAAAGERLHGITGSAWGEERNPDWLTVPVRVGSPLLDVVDASGRLGVSLLGPDARDLVSRFADPGLTGAQRFAGVDIGMEAGAPVLRRSGSWYVVDVTDSVAFGLYSLLVCRIVTCREDHRFTPMVFVSGASVVVDPASEGGA